jgi:phosphate acetyltransferase
MELIRNKTYNEIQVGDSASLSRTLTMNDITSFAAVTGDYNPAHMDYEYAKGDIFHRIVAHGMWGGSLFSTLLGMKLPGPGTIYLSQSLKFLKPVSIDDEVTVTVTVKEKKKEGNRIILDCTCTNQNKEKVITGTAEVIVPTERIERPVMSHPVELLEPRRTYYQQIIDKKNGLKPLITAVVHPVDKNSLEGAIEAAKDGLIIPILVGPEAKIRAVAKAEKLDISAYEIVATEHSHAAAKKAVELARLGKVEALMKGKIHTDELMEPIIDKETGLRTGRRMSHVFMVDSPNYYKPFFMTDAAINIFPNLMDKKDITQNAIDLFLALDLGIPKVAIVSAVETVNEKIPSTLDATALCKMAERGQITGGILDGPLALDNAFSKESAMAKDIVSEVAGDADIIVVPDVESGNILYKQLSFLSGAEAAGIVLGARVPIILTSRASKTMTRKASSALALIYARSNKKIV